ncbi:enoyl-CoA hydratase-related protein [Variovorax ginsengisoli]|uniref:Enoyl-CoA hydratase/carnithine racemase n=1 Tax=Variovorax ginsengisoli TaxID=363844 RepID=A0ABT9S9D7_9BURK|nr:enoyl-CoA hydratase-related protein [Variovorax ginsengisoli]MDP9900973.1 enoyl-CoA hydratase/carnithine racemase [Variovorax ginsengisoli]
MSEIRESMDALAPDAIVALQREGAVGIVRLNRPDKRNALDLAMRRAIAQAVTELDRDDDIGAIVITGGDTVFAAGADLNLLVDQGAQAVADIDLGQYWAPVARCGKPVIAAVQGHALGAGCELAMMCDFIVADPSARFGQPELGVGIMPGAGGTQRLLRAVGRPVASMLLLTGEMLTGERAFQLGLVADLAEPGETLARATALARRATRMPPKAVRATRRVLLQGADLPLDAALALENREFLLLFDTADKHEGMRAFLDKRKPVFTGR